LAAKAATATIPIVFIVSDDPVRLGLVASLARPAARAIGLQIQVLNADTSREIDAAFAAFERERADALFVASSAYFTSRRVQLVQLAARHAVPSTYVGRQYVEIGGLIPAARIFLVSRIMAEKPQTHLTQALVQNRKLAESGRAIPQGSREIPRQKALSYN
jgi:ABC-type uncharacterized transport system substrate-binding protein